MQCLVTTLVTEKGEPVDCGMLEEARGNLLAYYTSQIRAHGNYIVALFIGFLTLLAIFNSLPAFVSYALTSVLFGLLVCISGRTVFYGYLSIIILQIDPELTMPKPRKTSIMDRLHLDATKRIGDLADGTATDHLSRLGRYWYKIAISFGSLRLEIMILSSLISSAVLVLATLILRVNHFI